MSRRASVIANVNDDEAARYVISTVLRRAGFVVLEASTGLDALALSKRSPDLFVLDVSLPDLDGFEVCRRIKAEPSCPSLVLHLSARMTSSENRVQGLECGADGYLVQPVEPAELIATVQALLRLKSAEETARSAGLQWQASFDAVSDGVSLVGPSGEIARCNAAFAALLGRKNEEIIGRPFEGVLQDGLGVGHAVPSLPLHEHRVVEARVGERWFRIASDPVRDVQGNPDGAVRVLVDITAARAMEEELRRRAEALVEADQRKDEFLAMLAHELRNPLAALTTGLHLMQKVPGIPPRTAEVVNRQAAHLSRLVDDLLDVSRITHGRVELRKERADLGVILQHAVQSRRPMMDARDLRVSATYPVEPLPLEADVTRLEQVFGNLLDNAIKFSDPGGQVHITLEHELEGEASGARVRITDAGVGIAPEMLDRVFDLFAQSDKSLDRTQGGLGLGLTLVRKLVMLHGGKVTAHSAGLGKGAEFRVCLPLTAVSKPQSPVAPKPTLAANGRRVLLIEDNADAREMLAELLGLWGHAVDIAEDGPAGVALALSSGPEVAVVDVGLPGLNGFEVAERIRQSPIGQTVHLIALTGYGGPDQRARAVQAGFDLHLVKPVDPDVLRGVLENLKDRSGKPRLAAEPPHL